MCRVLTPGTLPSDGCQLRVVERPHARWPLSRVASLLYGIEGACDNPAVYVLPGFSHTTPGGCRGAGGGKQAVLDKWQGTLSELRELAGLRELASFEWKDEFAAMQAVVGGWDCVIS